MKELIEKRMRQEPTKVVLLGTGNPNPDPNHSGPSLAILVGDSSYVVDAGPGLVRKAAAVVSQHGGEFSALEAINLNKIFLTHLHSDHTIGYPDLILTPWIMGRDEPLVVYGPIGTKKLTKHILKAYQDDIQYRLAGLEAANSYGWKVNAYEISEGLVYKDDQIRVIAFPVKHGTLQNSFGFRFETHDKVIVISGDTAPCENTIKYSSGADILIHEVYCHAALLQKSKAWKNYHKAHHTSTIELARLASDVNPGLLVTYHTLSWGATDHEILDEISSIYQGPILIGRDLQIIV